MDDAIRSFYAEVIPVGVKIRALNGLESLSAREKARWLDNSRLKGIRIKPVKGQTRALGTTLPQATFPHLEVIQAWTGATRQQAIELCLRYKLRVSGPPNPNRGELSRTMHPPLIIPDTLKYRRLRFIVENEFL